MIMGFEFSDTALAIALVLGIIGILFIGFCTVVTVADYLFQLYEYLQRRKDENNDDKAEGRIPS